MKKSSVFLIIAIAFAIITLIITILALTGAEINTKWVMLPLLFTTVFVAAYKTQKEKGN